MPEHDAADLLTVTQALAVLDQTPVHPRKVNVPLDAGLGRRLAEDLLADRDYPPFRKSIMDGYAVRSSEVQSAGATLKVVAEIPAGTWPDRALQRGEAMAIMTGAPLPELADGVAPVENVAERVGPGGTIRLERPVAAARFVADAGSDCPAGRVVLRRGTTLSPAQIAVAASIGAAIVPVFAPPRVSILGTGDELSRVDQVPGPAQIRDSNTPMLAALLTQWGCEVIDKQRSGDDPAALRQAIERGTEADALFITGGMSMGEYDHIPRLLRERGMTLRISKLRMKPGKPFVFATPGTPPSSFHGFVFGLPGNPVSAFITTVRLARRLLTRIAGGVPEERWLSGQLTSELSPAGNRDFYQPAVVNRSAAGPPTITPLAWKGSADMFTLALANSLIVRPADDPARRAGDVVTVMEL